MPFQERRDESIQPIDATKNCCHVFAIRDGDEQPKWTAIELAGETMEIAFQESPWNDPADRQRSTSLNVSKQKLTDSPRKN